MKKRGEKKKRGSAITDILPWIILGVFILVLLMITIFILKGKGVDIITQIKNIFKGG